jgi:hypothetical protein
MMRPGLFRGCRAHSERYMARIPLDPPGGKPPDLKEVLKEFSDDDPERKLLSEFRARMNEAFAEFERDQAARRRMRVPPSPKQAFDLALFQFSTVASTALRIVKDDTSAFRCERELADLITGTMNWFAEWLRGSCSPDEDTRKFCAELCTELHLQLLELSRDAAVTMWKSLREQEISSEVVIGRNIHLLRKECGWSLRRLAEAIDSDHTNVRRHIAGKGMHPDTQATYAKVFTRHLGRTITPTDLEKPDLKRG